MKLSEKLSILSGYDVIIQEYCRTNSEGKRIADYSIFILRPGGFNPITKQTWKDVEKFVHDYKKGE